MTERPDVRRRHRERRLATRRRLLDATAALLEDRPWSEVTLEDVTSRARLTRTAFYRHFRDQRALLLALLEDLGVRLDLVADAWERGDGDHVAQLRAALVELVGVFHRHGRLLRAVADAATQDREVAQLYAGLGERLSTSAAERIAAEVAAGRSRVSDPEEVAAALVWMNERYLLDRFGRAPLADPARTADALAEVWLATVYRR
jgi:AcrR family transcriptional regulator